MEEVVRDKLLMIHTLLLEAKEILDTFPMSVDLTSMESESIFLMLLTLQTGMQFRAKRKNGGM